MQNKLTTELDMRMRGEQVKLRGPDGNRMHSILMQWFPHQGWESDNMPALEEGVLADDRSMVNKSDMSEHALVGELALIVNHFELLVSGANSAHAIGEKLNDAVHCVMEMPHLPRLM